MREVIVEQATGKVVTDNIDPDYFVDGVEFFRSGSIPGMAGGGVL